eukprot:702335-Hanusia_phi.AAC.4
MHNLGSILFLSFTRHFNIYVLQVSIECWRAEANRGWRGDEEIGDERIGQDMIGEERNLSEEGGEWVMEEGEGERGVCEKQG